MSGGVEVVVFPRIAGVQWSDTIGSTLWGMASDAAVVLHIVLGLAEIAPAFCQPLQVAFCGPSRSSLACTSGGGARGGPGPPGRSTGVHIRRSGRHVEVPDPSRGVRGSGRG